MRNAPFEVHPIAGALGAELRGVNLAEDLPDATIGAIRQALLDHLVIFFRDQDLPPERFLSLARRFGTPIEYPFVKGIEGFPEIINVAKLEHETVNFGGVWHSDTIPSKSQLLSSTTFLNSFVPLIPSSWAPITVNLRVVRCTHSGLIVFDEEQTRGRQKGGKRLRKKCQAPCPRQSLLPIGPHERSP